jgi:hypothetical protein
VGDTFLDSRRLALPAGGRQDPLGFSLMLFGLGPVVSPQLDGKTVPGAIPGAAHPIRLRDNNCPMLSIFQLDTCCVGISVWGLKTLFFDHQAGSPRLSGASGFLADGPGYQADTKQHLLADSQAKVMRKHFSATAVQSVVQ